MFREASALPGLDGVLGDGESPLWLVDPPADACTRMLALFRAADDDGGLTHDFTDPSWSTRFLGDLYQDLSVHAQKTYALLQTPDFVEEFILDRTLTPALEAFGLAKTTLIDPTCGSGHFLLGAFHRLFQAWRAAEPGASERDLAQRALDAVTGVDLNPFAASIARFRLLIAALQASHITRLADAPQFHINVAVGDSLLWGGTAPSFKGFELGATGETQFVYRTEHAEDLRRIFAKRYTAVVGNPPYIIARDKELNAQYRYSFPKSCRGKYSLAAPFMEAFFDLAGVPDSLSNQAGCVGMITANSFMKREFGKGLIEQCIPSWDVTHVIDTSGAYIPGHGTPTVILFGRNQAPVKATIRTVMGIRGEPATPNDPRCGLVWQAILEQVDHPESPDSYVSVGDVSREIFARHPWSVGGGGASALRERLEAANPARLGSTTDVIGFGAITGADDAYAADRVEQWRRRGAESHHLLAYAVGDAVRDWGIVDPPTVIYPYGTGGGRLASLPAGVGRVLWANRTTLTDRLYFGKTNHERNMPWWEFAIFFPERLFDPPSIAFASVSTHNHFVLDRGDRIFKQSAPIIKLSASGRTLDAYFRVLGCLNSSVGCFWMKQVFHNKGASTDGRGARVSGVDAWDNTFDHDGSKLKAFPLPGAPGVGQLASTLDRTAKSAMTYLPSGEVNRRMPSRLQLDRSHAEADRIAAEMVALQEELDWECLHLYGLTEEPLTVPEGGEAPPLNLGERAFEIILARKVAAGELETAWFTRHRSRPITEIPGHWPQWYRDLVARRIELIETDRDVGLVERPEHKRRWVREPWEKLEQAALQDWLLDRLEDRRLWFDGSGDAERATCRSVAQLADRVAAIDPDFAGVARLWKGTVEIDPVAVIAELVADEHVPAQAAARYKGKGMDKRGQWERTWDLQRMEDLGEPLPDGMERIPVPPKYGQGDFAKTSYWRQRGKLDVPKERFTSVAGAERDADPTLVLAWAGFDHAELAQAIGTVLVERQQTDGWDADRAWPLVVALAELLPWLDQWHSEVDARWGDSPAGLYRTIAEQQALAGGRTLADAPEWRPPAPVRGRKKAST